MALNASLMRQRQRRILRLLEEEGGVRTHELAERLGISEATVRRDLAALAERGLVERTHGGALPLRMGTAAEPPFDLKARHKVQEKERIAERAAALVPEGATVILDSGTTALALARRLADRRITAIALDLKVAEALARGAAEVWLVGGRVRNGLFSLVGPWVEGILSEVHADFFFLGADAVDEEAVTNATVEEAAVKRRAAAASQATFLIADHSKFGRRALAKVVDLDALAGVITDEASASFAAALKEKVPVVELV